MPTSTDLVKQALAWSGTRTTITSLSDGSNEANYATLLYAPLRDFLLREGDYDFAMKTTALSFVATGALPWSFAYTYPTDCLRVRQLIPTVYDPLDPQPIVWNIVNAAGTRQIYTKEAASIIIYTFPPDENAFDAMFTKAFVDLLASSLTMALTNRLEFSKEKLQEAITFAGIANLRDS